MCSEPNPRPIPTPAPPPTPVAVGRRYPEEVRQGFIQACVESTTQASRDKAEGYCNCAVTKIEERFTLDEFVRLSLEMQKTNKLPDELVPIITDCISFLL